MRDELEQSDVKPAEAQVDAIEDSSASTETNTGDENQGKSMQEFIDKSMNQGSETDETPKTETDKGEVVESPEDKSFSMTEKDKEKAAEKGLEEEKEEKGEEKEEPAPEEQAEVKEGEPVPYERFKEVNEKAKQYEQTLKASESQVKGYRNITGFCERNNITPQQFHETMEIVAALNSGDFEKVTPYIKKLYEQCQAYTGESLPADIAEKVDRGLDLETARAWAKDRAKAALIERRGQKTVEQIERDRMEEFKRQTSEATDTWVASKAVSDPDFKEGSVKFDEVLDRYGTLVNQKDSEGNFVNPLKTSQSVVTLLERAYKDVSERAKKRNGGRPLTKKPLPSGQSSRVSTKVRFEDAKTLSEAVTIGMKDRGYSIK